jgi:hypothetical protein
MENVGVFCGHLVHFMVIWYTFSRFGRLSQEKSGNPGADLADRLERSGESIFVDRTQF